MEPIIEHSTSEDIMLLLGDIQANIRDLETAAAPILEDAKDLNTSVADVLAVAESISILGGVLHSAFTALVDGSLSFTQVMFDAVVSLSPPFFGTSLGEAALEARVRDLILSNTVLSGIFSGVTLRIESTDEGINLGLNPKYVYSQSFLAIVTLTAANPVVCAITISASFENSNMVVRAIRPTIFIKSGDLNYFEQAILKSSFDAALFSTAANAIFPAQRHIQFDDPLNPGGTLPIFDFHLNEAPCFVAQYHHGRAKRTDFRSVGRLGYDTVFAVAERQIQRYASDRAAPAIAAARGSIPNVDDVHVHAISIGNDTIPLYIQIYGRGSDSKSGCRGYGSCIITLGILRRGFNLELWAVQQGGPSGVSVWGSGWTCEIGDWITHWKDKVRGQLNGIRIPDQMIVNQAIPGAREVVVLGRKPFFIIAINFAN